MPKLSSKAPSVPPSLSPESAPVWARLRNYVRRTERRILLVIRHDSPQLPRELPPLLADESGRTLITATVSDAEPDPMAAAIRAAPGGFPARALLSITGAEDLDVSTAHDSPAALYEFARRLDLRRDQFLPEGGVVLVWANARVFDALAEHALNFISRAAAVLTLGAAGEKEAIVERGAPSVSFESLRGSYDLPPLPPDAPADLRAALDAFEKLAVANELYQQGGSKIAHGLARFDAARDRIEAGWEAARRWSGLDSGEASRDRSSQAWQILCVDKKSGKRLWEKTATQGSPKDKRHIKSSYANSTPATDGEHVVALFGSEGLFCYTVRGEFLWKKELGRMDVGAYDLPSYEWGGASSPIRNL